MFNTTHWSVVLLAGGNDSPQATEALAILCRAYWFPLYAYVRRQGHTIEDGQDFTQAFFARLLERKSFHLADRNRGRFRTFLLTSLKHFLINEWRQAKTQKRGGGCQFISLDGSEMETRFLAEPADNRTPDKAFDRRWAMAILNRVLDQLQAEFSATGRGPLFDELKPFLTGDDSELTYAEIGKRLGMSEGSIKVNVHRLRQRHRELLRKEVSMTVDDPDLVDEEIRELLAALND